MLGYMDVVPLSVGLVGRKSDGSKSRPGLAVGGGDWWTLHSPLSACG